MNLYSPATGAVTNLNDPVQFAGTEIPRDDQGKIGDTYWQWDAGTNRELNIWFKYPPPENWVKFIGVAIPPDRLPVAIRYGNSRPSAVGIQNGDVYIYLDDSIPRKLEVYTAENGRWNRGAVIQIPTVYYGSGNPSGTGVDGDIYIKFDATGVELWAWDTSRNPDAWVRKQSFVASGGERIKLYHSYLHYQQVGVARLPSNGFGEDGDICLALTTKGRNKNLSACKKVNGSWQVFRDGIQFLGFNPQNPNDSTYDWQIQI